MILIITRCLDLNRFNRNVIIWLVSSKDKKCIRNNGSPSQCLRCGLTVVKEHTGEMGHGRVRTDNCRLRRHLYLLSIDDNNYRPTCHLILDLYDRLKRRRRKIVGSTAFSIDTSDVLNRTTQFGTHLIRILYD